MYKKMTKKENEMKQSQETIAAISTAMGQAGIGIVRLSGESAFAIADKIYIGPKERTFAHNKDRSIHYGHIIEPKTGNRIDEVLISKMYAPHTYTGEDVVEINCHGGITVVKEVLFTVIEAGARLAEPGEFTKRAFINGRIDLLQAEAVMDIISAKTAGALRIAQSQLSGRLSKAVRAIKEELTEILSYIGVGIEYPEYDVPEADEANILDKIARTDARLQALYENAKRGQVLKEGIQTAIVGKPNAGKSMLLNALIDEERAIVTDIPGTTRDVVQESVNLKGFAMNIIDTAGIREAENLVEQIGISRTMKVIEEAQIILFVLDNTKDWEVEDDSILKLVKDKQTLFVVNKIDATPDKNVADFLTEYDVVKISALTGEGIDELIDKIAVIAGINDEVIGDKIAANLRHRTLLEKALASMASARASLEGGREVDLIEIDIRDCWRALSEMVGEAVDEDIVDAIFSNFCLGK